MLSEAKYAILDMRLQKLTGLERDKVRDEYDERSRNGSLTSKLSWKVKTCSEDHQEELREVKEKYGDERRTDISFSDGEISIEDMIPDEGGVVMTISHLELHQTHSDHGIPHPDPWEDGDRGKTRDADFYRTPVHCHHPQLPVVVYGTE